MEEAGGLLTSVTTIMSILFFAYNYKKHEAMVADQYFWKIVKHRHHTDDDDKCMMHELPWWFSLKMLSFALSSSCRSLFSTATDVPIDERIDQDNPHNDVGSYIKYIDYVLRD